MEAKLDVFAIHTKEGGATHHLCQPSPWDLPRYPVFDSMQHEEDETNDRDVQLSHTSATEVPRYSKTSNSGPFRMVLSVSP